MPVTTAVLYASLLVQALGALLTGAVLGSFYGYYRKPYLLQWMRSWFAGFVMLLGGALDLALGASYAPTHLLRVAAAVAVSVAGYLQIGWLLLGTRELATGEQVSRRVRLALLALLGTTGGMVAALFLRDPGAPPVAEFLKVGVRSLIGSAGFIAAAFGIWRGHRGRRGLGHFLLLGTFAAYGFQQFHYFGESIAALFTRSAAAAHFLLGFLDFLLQFGMALGMVIWLLEDERKASVDAARQIEHLAFHDTLTGLPNRQLFLDRLKHAMAHAHRSGHQIAVFFLDLDRFKIINDSLGHSVGDRLLQEVAQRITTLLREEDTVTRLGGDEFTILAPRVRGAEDAVAVARKVRDAVKTPFVIDGRELFVTTSIGISLYPSDGDNAETLLKNADSAMYRAKAQGRDLFQLYTASMNEHALEQLALESSLRRAVVNREFDLLYQPVVDMESGRVCAVETVLRWRHPERGVLLPEDFVLLSEATGLIVPIGEWVLRTACRQVKQWQERGHAELRAAVNLSARQLKQPDFVAVVSQILGGTGLPPSSLELELAESAAMQTDAGALQKLRELKHLGVRISIDDFGTGYSSLGALRLFPVDALKIDRSFIQDITGGSGGTIIPSAVIALAHSLKLSVTAEGVETPAQLEFLRARNCDTWQGYLFSHPVAAEECEQVLARQVGVHTLHALPRPRPGAREEV